MKIEIDIDDATGAPTSLPDALKPWTQKQFNEGFQKGSAKKAEELTPLITDPAKVATLENENRQLKIAQLESENKHKEAQALRDEQHKKDIDTRDTAIKTRDERLRLGVNAEIKAAALKAGARNESLDELTKLLGGEIHFDEQLNPFVKGADGKPAVDDKQQPLTIEGRVVQYLDKNRHHLRPTAGDGGGAGGGATFSHLPSGLRELEEKRAALKTRIANNSRDDAAVTDLHEVNQQIAKAKKG